jgi:hypothetical protein
MSQKPSAPEKQGLPATGLTLQEYAAAKNLPLEFLEKIAIREIYIGAKPAVAMPYRDADGKEAGVRFRSSMEKHSNPFTWRKGSRLVLYGAWRLPEFSNRDFVCVIEGESDTQTLWLHKLPALGLPGANSWKEEWAEHFEGFQRIYVFLEPDKGGEAVLRWLTNSKIRNRVRLVRLRNAKDVSELYLKDQQGFRDALKAAMKDAQPWAEFERKEIEKRAKKLWPQCKLIAENDDVLEDFAAQMAESGLAGEGRKIKLLYLALTSRILDKPVSIGVKGPSSAGKSHIVERVLQHFPEDAYYVLTGMSERALAYSDEPLSHRFLVLSEAAALAGDFANYLVRSLLSEGRVVYETVEKVGGELHSRRIEREGPTGLLVTTTAISLHPENETRYLSVRVDDSPEQTARILLAEARKVSRPVALGTTNGGNILNWRAYQEWLSISKRPVIIPFADALAELIPPVAVRLRRDFPAILSLVQAHAHLHLASRKVDAGGFIVATLEDYGKVRELVHGLVREGVERGVGKTIRETVEAVGEIVGDSGTFASVSAVAKSLHLDRSSALRRVYDCLKRDYLRTDGENKKGRKMRLALGEPLPAEQEILPSVENIIERMKKSRKKVA